MEHHSVHDNEGAIVARPKVHPAKRVEKGRKVVDWQVHGFRSHPETQRAQASVAGTKVARGTATFEQKVFLKGEPSKSGKLGKFPKTFQHKRRFRVNKKKPKKLHNMLQFGASKRELGAEDAAQLWEVFVDTTNATRDVEAIAKNAIAKGAKYALIQTKMHKSAIFATVRGLIRCPQRVSPQEARDTVGLRQAIIEKGAVSQKRESKNSRQREEGSQDKCDEQMAHFICLHRKDPTLVHNCSVRGHADTDLQRAEWNENARKNRQKSCFWEWTKLIEARGWQLLKNELRKKCHEYTVMLHLQQNEHTAVVAVGTMTLQRPMSRQEIRRWMPQGGSLESSECDENETFRETAKQHGWAYRHWKETPAEVQQRLQREEAFMQAAKQEALQKVRKMPLKRKPIEPAEEPATKKRKT